MCNNNILKKFFSSFTYRLCDNFPLIILMTSLILFGKILIGLKKLKDKTYLSLTFTAIIDFVINNDFSNII